MNQERDPSQGAGAADVRDALVELIRQLGRDTRGRFDFTVSTKSEDRDVVELEQLINYVLKSAHRSVNEARKKTHFLAKTNTELKKEFEVRNRTESMLLQSEARIRAIVDSAAEGIVTFTHEGLIDSFNVAAQGIFGLRGRDARKSKLGRLFASYDDHLVEDDQVDVDALLAATEFRGLHADGTEFPMSVAISSFTLNGETSYTALIRDLSEERKLQAQLSQAQKLESIGQLAAGIAHEINTPTQYVADNLRFLQESFGDLVEILAGVDRLSSLDDEAERAALIGELARRAEEADMEFLVEEIPESLQQSTQGLESIANIVRAMKEFSHPGKSEKSPVDLAKAITNTITVARNEWKYVADVETEFATDLPPVPCLESEFNQVVLNLIVNASHALEERVASEGKKGKIRLSTAREGNQAVVRVADNGVGIPQEVRDRIFDPFFTTKDVGKGTGQGLAIARSVIVDKHDGEISVEGEPGAGTTFVIRLPLEVVAEAA